MISSFNYTKGAPLALLALTAALLQPVAYAQSTAKPSSEPIQGGKSDSPSMPSGGMDMKNMDMKGMDMKAMMKDCQEKMSSMKMTGNSDMDFAMMMRMHHQGAIDMAEAELRDGKEPQMRKMANGIVVAQKKEIAQLDAFLAKQGHPADKLTK